MTDDRLKFIVDAYHRGLHIKVVDHNPEDPGTWEFNCPKVGPVYHDPYGPIPIPPQPLKQGTRRMED